MYRYAKPKNTLLYIFVVLFIFKKLLEDYCDML